MALSFVDMITTLMERGGSGGGKRIGGPRGCLIFAVSVMSFSPPDYGGTGGA